MCDDAVIDLKIYSIKYYIVTTNRRLYYIISLCRKNLSYIAKLNRSGRKFKL